MSEERGISAGTVLLSFVAGAAIGAGLALLYAPKKGTELRESLSDFADDAAEKIKEYTKEAQDKIMAAIEEGKDAIGDKKSILASAIEAGRQAMQKERDKSAT